MTELKYDGLNIDDLRNRARASRANALPSQRRPVRPPRKISSRRSPRPNRRLEQARSRATDDETLADILGMVEEWEGTRKETMRIGSGGGAEALHVHTTWDDEEEIVRKDAEEIELALVDWEIPEAELLSAIQKMSQDGGYMLESMLLNVALSQRENGKRSVDVTHLPFDLELDEWQSARSRKR